MYLVPIWVKKGVTNVALCNEDKWANGYIDECFLDLCNGWRLVVTFTPLPFYPKERTPWYPFDRRLGGPQSWSGQYEEVTILDPT
jgi:hypothetical protein